MCTCWYFLLLRSSKIRFLQLPWISIFHFTTKNDNKKQLLDFTDSLFEGNEKYFLRKKQIKFKSWEIYMLCLAYWLGTISFQFLNSMAKRPRRKTALKSGKILFSYRYASF